MFPDQRATDDQKRPIVGNLDEVSGEVRTRSRDIDGALSIPAVRHPVAVAYKREVVLPRGAQEDLAQHMSVGLVTPIWRRKFPSAPLSQSASYC